MDSPFSFYLGSCTPVDERAQESSPFSPSRFTLSTVRSGTGYVLTFPFFFPFEAPEHRRRRFVRKGIALPFPIACTRACFRSPPPYNFHAVGSGYKGEKRCDQADVSPPPLSSFPFRLPLFNKAKTLHFLFPFPREFSSCQEKLIKAKTCTFPPLFPFSFSPSPFSSSGRSFQNFSFFFLYSPRPPPEKDVKNKIREKSGLPLLFFLFFLFHFFPSGMGVFPLKFSPL